jgi:hypothetical protein
LIKDSCNKSTVDIFLAISRREYSLVGAFETKLLTPLAAGTCLITLRLVSIVPSKNGTMFYDLHPPLLALCTAGARLAVRASGMVSGLLRAGEGIDTEWRILAFHGSLLGDSLRIMRNVWWDVRNDTEKIRADYPCKARRRSHWRPVHSSASFSLILHWINSLSIQSR